jgi:hypothetical protein
MRGAIHLFPQYVFMAWCFVKYSDNFTLLYFTCMGTKHGLSLLGVERRLRLSENSAEGLSGDKK